MFLTLAGPITYFPISALSKKQTAVSHATAGAKMAAADVGLRLEALPCMTLLDSVCGRKIDSRIMQTGKAPTLKRMRRTHRINIHWLCDVCHSDEVYFGACESHLMAADLLIKAFSNTESVLGIVGLSGFTAEIAFYWLFGFDISCARI